MLISVRCQYKFDVFIESISDFCELDNPLTYTFRLAKFESVSQYHILIWHLLELDLRVIPIKALLPKSNDSGRLSIK